MFYNQVMIGKAELTELLLEQVDRPLNPGNIQLLPRLIPDWRVAQELRITPGSEGAVVRLEASRNFATKTGLVTVTKPSWGRTDYVPNTSLILGNCTSTIVLGETPRDTVKRLNTSTNTKDRFYVSSVVTVEAVATLPTFSTHFIGHLMDIDLQLHNLGVPLSHERFETTIVENI